MEDVKGIATFITIPEMPVETFVEVANRFYENMRRKNRKKYALKVIGFNENTVELAFILNGEEKFRFRIIEQMYNRLKLWVIYHVSSEKTISVTRFKKYMTKLLKELPGITLLWIEPEAISHVIEHYGKGIAIATSIHDPLVLSKRALRKIPYEVYEEIEVREYNIPRTIEVKIKAPAVKIKTKLRDIKRAVQVEYIDVIFRFRSHNPGPAEVLLNEDAFVGVITKSENISVTKSLWNNIFTDILSHESKLIEIFHKALPKYEEIKLLNTTLTVFTGPGESVKIALKSSKDKPITRADIIAYAMALTYGASGVKGYFFYGKIIDKNNDNIKIVVYDGLHGGNYYITASPNEITITPAIGATIGGLLALYRFTREHFNWNAEIVS